MNKFTHMLLLEISLQDHFDKYILPKYPEVPFQVYELIANIDPTTRNGQRGKYVEWLFKSFWKIANSDSYKGNLFNVLKVLNLGQMDISKDDIHKTLERYDRYPKKDDINTFSSLWKFMDYVKALPPTANEEKQKDKEIFGDKDNIHIIDITEDWIVAQPLTHQGSIKLARYKTAQSAKWCTADPANDHHCKVYNSRGVLINFLNRKNPMDKVQVFVSTENGEIAEVRDFYNENIPKEKQDMLIGISERVQNFIEKKLGITEKIMAIDKMSFHRKYGVTSDFISKAEAINKMTEPMYQHVKEAYNQYVTDLITVGNDYEANKQGLFEFLTYQRYEYLTANYLSTAIYEKVLDRFLEYGMDLFEIEYYEELMYCNKIPQETCQFEHDTNKLLSIMDRKFRGRYGDEIKSLANRMADSILDHFREKQIYCEPNSDAVTKIKMYVRAGFDAEMQKLNDKLYTEVFYKVIDRMGDELQTSDENLWQKNYYDMTNSLLSKTPKAKDFYLMLNEVEHHKTVDLKKVYMLLLPKNSDYFETDSKPFKAGTFDGFDGVYNIRVKNTFTALLDCLSRGVFENYPTAIEHMKQITVPLYKEIVQLMMNNPNHSISVDDYTDNVAIVVNTVGKGDEFYKLLKETYENRAKVLKHRLDTKTIDEDQWQKYIDGLNRWLFSVTQYLEYTKEKDAKDDFKI